MTEVERFLDAVRFLTIAPTPPSTAPVEPDWLARCMKYFPLVGVAVGCFSGLVFLLAHLVWGAHLAALLAVGASILITAALHEDGLADSADGLGGGWTVEKRLAIMKDSRIGGYGAIALVFSILLRAAALISLAPWTGVAALVAGHAVARLVPAFLMNNMNYVGDTAAMKVTYDRAPMTPPEFRFALVAALVAVLPLAIVTLSSALAGLVCGCIFAIALAKWSQKLLGGYTGDILGAAEQVFEIGFLMGVAAFIR
jgi:adenosylcobinamide-GDP ribazoletransferase